MTGTVFTWPPQPQILMKSKNFSSHQTENCLEIILGSEIYSKAHFYPELQMIKVQTKNARFVGATCTFNQAGKPLKMAHIFMSSYQLL